MSNLAPNERLIGALRMLERQSNDIEHSLTELRGGAPFGSGKTTEKTDECLRLAVLKSIELSRLISDARGWEITG